MFNAAHLHYGVGSHNLKQTINIRMFARIRAGIRDMLGIKLRGLFGGAAVEATIRHGHGMVDRNRSRAAGTVFDAANDCARGVKQLQSRNLLDRRQVTQVIDEAVQRSRFQRTSPPAARARERAITNSRSDRRFK